MTFRHMETVRMNTSRDKLKTLCAAVVWCTFAMAPRLGATDRQDSNGLIHELFQSHGVLQRDRPIPIWGEAQPREQVWVAINELRVEARADAVGHWQAVLPAMQAGGPYSLTVSSASGRNQTLTDVLVGDVYLCSGQSNMEFPVTTSLNAAREISNSGNDSIRLLSVTHAVSATAARHFQAPVSWLPADPASVRDFSAVCYYFARELQKSVPVPLGLIHASWGGSRIEPWVSGAGLRAIGGYEQGLDLLHSYATDAERGNQALGTLWETWWHAHAIPHSTPWSRAAEGHWQAVPEPMRDWKTWGVPELANHDGMVWFRRSIVLTPEQAASAATLAIGAIDEVDETWVNGIAIGNSFGYGTERVYRVPSGVLHAGENSIVINVLSTWDAGGMYGPAERLALRFGATSSVALSGHWLYQFVPERTGLPPRAPWESVSGLSSIYNAMIAPIAAYGLRGVLWYQGESNAGEAERYQALLTGLMRDWRRQFAAELPFLIVELPNFGAPVTVPTESAWANLREAQRRAVADDSRASLAVTIDLGNANELHPPDKRTVGVRLARAALHLIYGRSASASGPTPVAARRDAAHVVVDFDGVDGALRTYSAMRPIGFELCGASSTTCRFVDASVNSDAVILTVTEGPVQRVRFCWGDAPVCNLYDEAGSPAGPFEIPIH
jgi:sialate O-acetylesterase